MDGLGMSRPPTTAMTHDVFDDLATELNLRSRGKGGRRALERLAAIGAPLDGAVTLCELADRCHCGGRQSTVLLGQVLKLAPFDELLALTALVALRPALRRVAGRVGRRESDRSDTDQVVLASAWATVRTSGLWMTPSAVVSRVWSEAKSELRRTERRASRELLLEPGSAQWPATTYDDRPTDGLGRRIAECRVTTSDLQLLRLVRIAGVPVREVARTLGIPRSTLHDQLQRTERRLRVAYRGSR